MNFESLATTPFRPADEIAALQQRLLRQHLRHCIDASPFYRQLLAGCAVRPEEFRLEDLVALPQTDKDDLGAHNDAFLATPMNKVVDIVQSSGTTGVPTRIMYSERDLQRLAYNERQAMSGTGLTSEDVVLLTCTMDRCFIAGLAYFMGLRALGAATVRNGNTTLESHRELILRMRPTALVGVPSFLRKLGNYLAEMGHNLGETGIKRLICIGEPLRDGSMEALPICQDLQCIWGAQVYSTYASSEIVTSFCECEACNGGHLPAELGIVEIVDEKGQHVRAGETGEVVVTPLLVEAMPLIRFRTGDISFLMSEPCSCGRNTPRLGPIIGRKKQMIKYKGTTIYPESIAVAMDQFGGVAEHYVEVQQTDTLSDQVVVHVSFTGDQHRLVELKDFLASRLRVRPVVVLDSVSDIRQRVYQSRYRKPMRFFDRRVG